MCISFTLTLDKSGPKVYKGKQIQRAYYNFNLLVGQVVPKAIKENV